MPRHEDLLLEIRGLMARSSLPLPPFLSHLYQGVVSLAQVQRTYWLDDFVANMQDMSSSIYRLTQQAEDPTLAPSTLGCLRAQMTATVAATRAMSKGLQTDQCEFVRGTLALMQYNASFSPQAVIQAQRAQLEQYQLSLAQVANLATRCLDIFEQLRALSPQCNVMDPLTEALIAFISPETALAAMLSLQMANFTSFVNSASNIVDTRLQALATSIVRLTCDEWMSEQQFLRWHSWTNQDTMMPNLYPLVIVVVDAYLLGAQT
ncbi:hypothetical protein WJX73_001366 [Symbiochloris irregularis]|uniref:Uncharacterized protein n=1 Tax=Symbiochloris irregularis TaxID=706552 RepID=A0AAW1NID6_9CHLO